MNASPVRAIPDSVSAQRSRSPADGTNGSVTASRRGRALARRLLGSPRAAVASSPARTLARSRRTTSRISGTVSRSWRASSASISDASISPRPTRASRSESCRPTHSTGSAASSSSHSRRPGSHPRNRGWWCVRSWLPGAPATVSNRSARQIGRSTTMRLRRVDRARGARAARSTRTSSRTPRSAPSWPSPGLGSTKKRSPTTTPTRSKPNAYNTRCLHDRTLPPCSVGGDGTPSVRHLSPA